MADDAWAEWEREQRERLWRLAEAGDTKVCCGVCGLDVADPAHQRWACEAAKAKLRALLKVSDGRA